VYCASICWGREKPGTSRISKQASSKIYLFVVGYLTTPFDIETTQHWIVGRTDEFENIWKWLNRGNIPGFAWRDWGKPRKTLIEIASVPATIRTEHLLDTSLKCYI
jgi:hypothetical protein